MVEVFQKWPPIHGWFFLKRKFPAPHRRHSGVKFCGRNLSSYLYTIRSQSHPGWPGNNTGMTSRREWGGFVHFISYYTLSCTMHYVLIKRTSSLSKCSLLITKSLERVLSNSSLSNQKNYLN